jgi:hypothetical protein
VAEDKEPTVWLPSQSELDAVPSFFVDGSVGTASAAGVARLTLGAITFNATEGAEYPTIKPAVTIQIPEASLVALAKEMLGRAKDLGISIEDD